MRTVVGLEVAPDGFACACPVRSNAGRNRLLHPSSLQRVDFLAITTVSLGKRR